MNTQTNWSAGPWNAPLIIMALNSLSIRYPRNSTFLGKTNCLWDLKQYRAVIGVGEVLTAVLPYLARQSQGFASGNLTTESRCIQFRLSSIQRHPWIQQENRPLARTKPKATAENCWHHPYWPLAPVPTNFVFFSIYPHCLAQACNCSIMITRRLDCSRAVLRWNLPIFCIQSSTWEIKSRLCFLSRDQSCAHARNTLKYSCLPLNCHHHQFHFNFQNIHKYKLGSNNNKQFKIRFQSHNR